MLYDKAMEDNKFELADLLLFIPLIIKSQDAFKDVGLISKEWGEASFDKKMMLAKEIEQELDLKSEKTEQIIESSVSLLISLDKLIKSIKG